MNLILWTHRRSSPADRDVALDQVWSAYTNAINVRRAGASVASDKELILGKVSACVGGGGGLG